MLACTPCALCCTVCAATQSKTPLHHAYGNPDGATQQPFALNKLLPAGTVTIRRASQEEPALCDHVHADDGWHVFNGTWHSGYFLNQDSASFCTQLGFLAKHEFIAATYNVLGEDTLVIRIYFIPVDLANVQGRLHHANRKDSVLLSARRYLRSLIPMVSQDHNQWHAGPGSEHKPLIYAPPDSRTLAEIYSDLASPRVDPSEPFNETASRLLDYNDDLEGLGFRSALYRYQRRSIAAMLTRELDLRAIPDPLYLPVTSMNGKPFYFQPGTLEIVNERGMVAPTRGGLLCEELGTGKTVVVLGLILSTLNQLPCPPETTAEPSPVLTPVALKAFPSAPFNTARQHLFCGQPQSHTGVPSLVELMLHRARTTPVIIPPNPSTARGRRQFQRRLEVESRFEMTTFNNLLNQNTPFYLYHHPDDLALEMRPKRSKKTAGPRIMYLSPATLVVVPSNLLSQWDREITKHCEYPLRVLILRSKTKIPPVKALATDYDIILMTYNRYTAEAAHKNISKLHDLQPCTCPNIPGSRVPECKCPNPVGVSPFLQIRWKRLVIDEGHVSASLSTNLTPFTKLLSVERRWIVTGTPTTNLLGLSLGKDSIAEFVLNAEDEEGSLELQYPESEDDEFVSSSSSGRSTPLDASKAPRAAKQRIWTKYDREDLYKLDNMITHFVAVPHFIANPKVMQTHVREPLMDRKGPRPGSIQILNQVMEMIMIRHRIEDVEKDIALPPVIHESVLLDLDPAVIKSYNALQATIVINAIDSQRTDQDYLFHPRNSEFLQLTVKNMSQLMFWSVDETSYNVDQLVQNAQATIARALSCNMSLEDIQLVQEAFRHVKLAATDPLWRRIQMHEDVPYRVYRMPHKIFNAWTRTPERDPSHHPTLTGFLHADRLLKLHDTILARPLASEDLVAEKGAEIAKSDSEARKAFEEACKRNKNKHNRKYTRSVDEAHAGLMVENAAKKAAAPDTLKEMRKELDHSLAKLERESEDEDSSPGASELRDNNTSNNLPSILVRSSVLADVAVGSSASSKLNYVINEVMHHSAKEKFLIFSESELTLAHVAEALELIHVKFLRFTTQIQPQIREQLVLTFETSETYRVFLMELKHGARGLNLISASRVIFCEPVWQADVESQAIKRAHRIGQTRSISVKTLAIRGTAEENMVERRHSLKGSHDKIPKLLEESGMRHFIANPKFLIHEPEKLPEVQFPLVHVPRLHSTRSSPGSVKLKIPALYTPLSTSPSPPSRKRVFVGDPIGEHDEAEHITGAQPPKKKKTVHFG